MACPICDKEETADFRPFCSKKCADIDLGNWLTERYRVPSNDLEDVDQIEDEGPSKIH